jgi:hypothetical protein
MVARKPEVKLRSELALRQITFAAEALDTAFVEDERRGCPQDVVAVEERAGFLDVGAERDEVLRNVRGDRGIVIRFGFQPNACASSRSSAEVHQQRLIFGFSARQRLVHVLHPLDCHIVSRVGIGDARRK